MFTPRPTARRWTERNTRIGRTMGGRSKRNWRGFTLIEMVIVIAIISILLSVAVPVYTLHLRHAKEAALKEDLYSIRNAIDQYTQDKSKAPQSLDDLVSAGYLRVLPKDPFT